VRLDQLDIKDFRNYQEAEVRPASSGVTVFGGDNGAGKTNVLEAVGFVATLRSFRGALTQAMVRDGRSQAVLRAHFDREARSLLVEVELNVVGRDKLRLNRQAVRRNDDLTSVLAVTVFSPDDIEVIKGGPGARRDYLDELLCAVHPRHGATLAELERVLRQRNALLRNAGGALRPGVGATLDVWDGKLVELGQVVALSRQSLTAELEPLVGAAYLALCAKPERAAVAMRYERSWPGDLAQALASARQEDLRRATTTVGPQRDDLYLGLNGLAARAQASQGEQRSLALALRLGGHRLVETKQGSAPVLLLDDIFSELDPRRCEALAAGLPHAQALLTTAGPVPAGLEVGARYQVVAGELRALH
jgi:DNA replication and repair protein RecF